MYFGNKTILKPGDKEENMPQILGKIIRKTNDYNCIYFEKKKLKDLIQKIELNLPERHT